MAEREEPEGKRMGGSVVDVSVNPVLTEGRKQKRRPMYVGRLLVFGWLMAKRIL